MPTKLLPLLALPLLSLACSNLPDPMIQSMPNDPVQDALFPGDPVFIPGPPGPFVNPHSYTVSVVTGNRDHAGTNANVFVVLEGAKDESTAILLNDPQRDDFERASTSTFTFDYADRLGQLRALWLAHDGTGFDPGWFVESVTVTDNVTHQTYRADLHTWLSVTDMPRQTRVYRKLKLVSP